MPVLDLERQIKLQQARLAKLQAAAQAVKKPAPKKAAPKPVPAVDKINLDRVAKLEAMAERLATARAAEADAWADAQTLIRDLHAKGEADGHGPSFVQISAAFSWSKARASQVCSGIRWHGETKDPAKYKAPVKAAPAAKKAVVAKKAAVKKVTPLAGRPRVSPKARARRRSHAR